ncbi:MAG: FmdB family zinc ribbon protein [Chloroflexota bacterium]
MPLYEYECCDCGVRFERRQKVHDEPVAICPDCSGPVRRLLFPVGIIFKGSGFYVTDSRRPQPIGDNGDCKPKVESKNGTDSSKPASESTSTPASKPAVEPAGSKI